MALAAKILTMLNSTIYEPSDDSFLLAETLKKIIPGMISKNKNFKFLEIGSGSGIQLEAALSSGVKKNYILSSDINPDAAEKCSELGFKCILSDLFEKIPKGKYDIIVFNPPYLPEDNSGKESKSSKVSTTGGKKGSEIINRFLKQAKKHLTEDGMIILLVSSLTKGLDFNGYKRKILAVEKLFFEKLIVLELS
jgi:release factor glutamine methyltransferase